MMKISHEVPIQFLDKSTHFNDYDYCLAHLMLRHQQGWSNLEAYYNFYMSRPNDRKIYLDNSAFELGRSVPAAPYCELIQKMDPYLFFIPDVVDSYRCTIDLANKWMDKHDHKIDKKVLRCQALQGKSIEQLIDHYERIRSFVSVVGVGYNYAFFSKDPTKRIQQRGEVVDALLAHNPQMWIHLLGCQSYAEFVYKRYPGNVISVDTSLPIMAAIDGVNYPDDGHMLCQAQHLVYYKSPHKLAENLDLVLNERQELSLYNNVMIFRNAVKGNINV